MYAIDIDKELMFPGDYGYKLSGDLFSGSSGVLLALETLGGKTYFQVHQVCFLL
ncbi:hypothetical protein D8878_11625 [Streptococcus sanguinis]|uniref:hypothetical protein n=1 Tax=Streptococcus sanguinis TaxID=1305 RepID=UPI000FBB653F|nr:hypothetical protein [Streptococcus sanguinis]RSI30199.1 hypothetical protein D8878_11625 [Streptococcus sanguinis]